MMSWMLRLLSVVLLSSLVLGCGPRESASGVAQAEASPPVQAAPAAPAAPATPPSAASAAKSDDATEKRAAELVGQLGAPDYQAREKASGELAALGKKALPELEKAAGSADAEVAKRAKELIEQIKYAEEEAQAPEIPGLAENFKGVRPGGHGPGVVRGLVIQGGPGVQVGPTVRSGGDTRNVGNDKGSISTSESSEGPLTLTISPKGGEAKTYQAGSREEFKKKYPRLYAKYFGE